MNIVDILFTIAILLSLVINSIFIIVDVKEKDYFRTMFIILPFLSSLYRVFTEDYVYYILLLILTLYETR